MRIYLTQRMVDGHTEYPAAGFYANVPSERVEEWIACGLAYRATSDNKVIAYDGDQEVLVDLDAGHRPQAYAPAPPVAPAPPPVETSPVVSEEGVI